MTRAVSSRYRPETIGIRFGWHGRASPLDLDKDNLKIVPALRAPCRRSMVFPHSNHVDDADRLAACLPAESNELPASPRCDTTNSHFRHRHRPSRRICRFDLGGAPVDNLFSSDQHIQRSYLGRRIPDAPNSRRWPAGATCGRNHRPPTRRDPERGELISGDWKDSIEQSAVFWLRHEPDEQLVFMRQAFEIDP